MLHSGKSGIGYYQSEIVRALLSQSGNDEYVLNYFDLSGKKRSTAEKYKSDNAEIQCCNWFNASIYQLIWSIFPLPYSFFFKSEPDVSVFFNYYLPPGVKGKKVLVVYGTVINAFKRLTYAGCGKAQSTIFSKFRYPKLETWVPFSR